MTRVLTGSAPAFFISAAYGPDNLVDAAHAIDAVSLAPWCRKADGSLRTPDGWVYVGEADVTLRLVNEVQLVDNKVEALRAEERQLLGETEARITEIRRKINTLLAITNDVKVAA